MSLTMTTAETGYGDGGKLSSIEAMVRKNSVVKVGTELDETTVVYACVRQSRWFTCCPWCPSAAYASTKDHRFFCVECGNAGADYKWIKVIWPDDPEAIEAVLRLRSNPATRCWNPGETVADLAAENVQFGAPGLVRG